MRMSVLLAAVLSTAFASPAGAWGFEGHEIVAGIARSELTPTVRAKVDAILAGDPDTLTAPDMASRATWADAWRGAGHRETAQWHFVDVELDGPDLTAACFGHPPSDTPASGGPAKACVVDRIRDFAAELSAPGTDPAERLLALKYLLHFVGDVHQPLHASDNHDRGGNCVLVSLGGSRTVNLHAFWDTVVVEEAVGRDAASAAIALRARITPAMRAEWRGGDASRWVTEAFQVARSAAYAIGSPPGCGRDAAPIPLPPGYDAAARTAAVLQLQRAGVRLGAILNRALADVDVGTPNAAVPVADDRTSTTKPPVARVGGGGRSAASLTCSSEADAQALHGKPRRLFRERCMRALREN